MFSATIADANSVLLFINSKIVCIPLDNNIDDTESREVVKEIHRQILFKNIDDDSIINTFNQTSLYSFEKLNDNTIINQRYGKWEPEIDIEEWKVINAYLQLIMTIQLFII